MSGTSCRLDETYVKVGTEWKYLYRAVAAAGCTIEFMLSANGVETAHMMRKGQVKRIDGSDAVGQATFVASLFGVAA